MTTASATRSEPLPKSSDAGTRHFVLFYVDEQGYGIATQYVQEVIPLPETVTLPTSPEFLEGFLNVAGVATPVVRVDRLVGLPRSESGLYTPVMILQGLDSPLALLVDRVHRVVQLAPHQIARISGSATVNDFAEGVAEFDGEQVIIVDPERLLLEEETRCLEALRETAQQRVQQAEAQRG
jgi:purine-binding chemotaxis protein CheW